MKEEQFILNSHVFSLLALRALIRYKYGHGYFKQRNSEAD